MNYETGKYGKRVCFGSYCKRVWFNKINPTGIDTTGDENNASLQETNHKYILRTIKTDEEKHIGNNWNS